MEEIGPRAHADHPAPSTTGRWSTLSSTMRESAAYTDSPGPTTTTSRIATRATGDLLVRHHSAVELVDRAAEAGLVCRLPDADDGRLVRLELTRRGRDLLERLSAAHLEELARLAPMVQRLAADLSV